MWETAKSFVDTHQNENGVLSAEDTETYGRMETEIQELTDAINRQSKMECLEKELSKPVNEPIREQPGSGTAEKKTGRGVRRVQRRNAYGVQNEFQTDKQCAAGGHRLQRRIPRSR